jgi:hypothetical protein
VPSLTIHSNATKTSALTTPTATAAASART